MSQPIFPAKETIRSVHVNESRIISLDHFRGYTVAGMFLVNFIGGYLLIPVVFKHTKTFCSYADTIMPQFFFAVGFAMRLTFLRHREKFGVLFAFKKTIWRIMGLLLLGLIIHNLDGGGWSWQQLNELGLSGVLSVAFKKNFFQTLTHIALASLWVLPVIDKKPSVRIFFICVSGFVHLALSKLFYFEWARKTGVIDGGPLGFMTWAIPVIIGSLAYDCVVNRGTDKSMNALALWGIILMAVGYALSCGTAISNALMHGKHGITTMLMEPPFFQTTRSIDIWTMSQQTGSISYQTFASGLSLLIYAIFIFISDIKGIEFSWFRILGQNALVAYILHGRVDDLISPFVPKDSPIWYISISVLLFFFVNMLIMKYLERRGYYLRL